MKATPTKTAADYLAMALCPPLIMGMVGSLLFFLLALLGPGQSDAQVRWTLFWFVLATVLVARIAIEQGRTYAFLYGLGLALATSLKLSQFNASLWVYFFLALAWWCTDLLTCNCTMLEEHDSTTDVGILQSSGLEDPARLLRPRFSDRANLNGGGQRGPSAIGQPHSPGVSILYFSLAALPLFGVGEWLLPVATREDGFRLLWIYCASSLGLLLATSFLGLRRYLRQLRLQMPTALAGNWLLMGGAVAGAMLVMALLLPRPQGWNFGLARQHRLFDPPQARQFVPLNAGESDASTPSHRSPSSPHSPSDPLANQDSSSPGTDPGSPSGEEGGKRETASGMDSAPSQSLAPENSASGTPPHHPSQAQARVQAQEASSRSTPASEQSAQVPRAWLRWVPLGLGILVVGWLLVRFRRELWQAWQEAWGRFRLKKTVPAKTVPPPTQAAFLAHYQNPFADGSAAAMTPEQLVLYSFAALQVKGREWKGERRPATTPLEFATQMEDRLPRWRGELRGVARLYTQLAYAPMVPLPECQELLERFWNGLEQGPEPPAVITVVLNEGAAPPATLPAG